MIFKDNLRMINPDNCREEYVKAYRLAEPVGGKPGRFVKSEHFLRKNGENKKIVGLFTRA